MAKEQSNHTSAEPQNGEGPGWSRSKLFQGLISATPIILSLVALGLGAYAFADFASFVRDYRGARGVSHHSFDFRQIVSLSRLLPFALTALEDEVASQSQKDFDFLVQQTIDIFLLMVSFNRGVEGCDLFPQLGDFSFINRLHEKASLITETLNRVTMAQLPVGPVWDEYFTQVFPADNGYEYGHFANPERLATVVLYGLPNMDPLFKTFRTSLVLDISCIMLFFLPRLIYTMKPQLRDNRRVDIILLVVDASVLLVSLGLLLTTMKLAESTSGYDVETVRGRAFFTQAQVATELARAIDPDYWKRIPQEYCLSRFQSCFPDRAYQANCSLAQIDVTVPKEYLIQEDDKWFVDIQASGSSMMEQGSLYILEAVFDETNRIVSDRLNFTFNNLLPSLPEEFVQIVDVFRNGIITGACPSNQQEFLWTPVDMQNATFPVDSPDYDHVCNTQCQNDFSFSKHYCTEYCPQGCAENPECTCRQMSYNNNCPSNCPTSDTSECGCGSFSLGLWNYNCSRPISAITQENYDKFTNFAVDNVREGLKYDIAATVVDFVAICVVAITLFCKRRDEQNKKSSSSEEKLFPKEELKRQTTQPLPLDENSSSAESRQEYPTITKTSMAVESPFHC